MPRELGGSRKSADLVAEEEGALTCDTAAHLISELKLRPPHFTVCCSLGLLTQDQYLFLKISLLLVIVPEICKSAPTSSALRIGYPISYHLEIGAEGREFIRKAFWLGFFIVWRLHLMCQRHRARG